MRQLPRLRFHGFRRQMHVFEMEDMNDFRISSI